MAISTEERIGVYKSLELEALGGDEFVNTLLWKGDKFLLKSAYGGQVVGQALMAACHTVADPDLLLLSAHCYFLAPVKTNEHVKYRVTRTKDGRSFASRSVETLQGGRVVSHTLASFKRPEATPFSLSHSSGVIPPGVFPPDDPRQDQERLVFNKRLDVLSSSPFDAYYCIRQSDQEKLLAREPIQPRMMSWVRCHGKFPNSQNEHRVALTFLSDFSMAFPLRLKYPEFRGGFMTSLDHAIWFHSPVHCQDSWFMLQTNCLQAGEGTSLNAGRLYSEDGTLVATCQQQALYRLNSKL